MLPDLRNYYCRAKNRNPDATKEVITDSYLFAAPQQVTIDTIKSYWSVLEKYSDVIRNNKPCPSSDNSASSKG